MLRHILFGAAIVALPLSSHSSLAQAASASATANAAPSPTATLSGDMYLTMQDGDIHRIAGTPIALVSTDAARSAKLRCGETADVDSAFMRAVRSFATPDSLDKRRSLGDRHKAMWAANDSADKVHGALARAIRAALDSAVLYLGSTNVDGHYRFAGVRPGDYALFAQTTVGDRVYGFLVPVAIGGADSSKDLNNTTAGTAYCNWPITDAMMPPWIKGTP